MTLQPAKRAARLDDPVLRTFQSVLDRAEIMSFGAGFMNPAGFDVTGVRAAFAAALADEQAASTLQYGLAEGSKRLRAAIVERMRALAVPADEDEILVTTGATQALDVLCNALLDPGDVVLVERPTYVVSLRRLAFAEARVVSVPGDKSGLDPTALEAAVLEHRPKFIYTIPTSQNPGGMTLPAERRAAVAEVAEKHGVVLTADETREERGGVAPHLRQRRLFLASRSTARRDVAVWLVVTCDVPVQGSRLDVRESSCLLRSVGRHPCKPWG